MINEDYNCNNNIQCNAYEEALNNYENYENQIRNLDDALFYYSSIFDLERFSIAYQFPLNDKYSKMKIGKKYEKQLFNNIFTEYDLKINIRFCQFSFNKNSNSFTLYYDDKGADNYTYLDGNYSTESMNRSYKEN